MQSKANRPSVAVIVTAAWHPEAELDATLAALSRQSCPPAQVLAVRLEGDRDAGRASDAAGRGGQNFAACLNGTLRQVQASLVVFLEAGMLLQDDWLDCIVSAFAEQPGMGAWQGPVEDGMERLGSGGCGEGAPLHRSAEHRHPPALNNFAIRREVICRLREPFSERIEGAEADELHWKLTTSGISVSRRGFPAIARPGGWHVLPRRWRDNYRTGAGLQQLRRLHDGFWDTRLNHAQSPAAALAWLRRELSANRRDGEARTFFHAAAHALLQTGLLAGLWRGHGRLLPQRDARASPEDLLFVVTNKCNLRCRHCFYTEELDKPTEALAAEAVARLVDSLTGDLRTVSFTGGEPFLCPDLVGICEILATRIGVRELYIISNGFYPERVAEAVERILGFATYRLFVRISLDGLEATHNRLRDNPRSFARALETLRRLKQLAGRYPRLSVQVQTSVGTHNLQELDGMSAFVVRELGLFQAFEFIRDVGMTAGGGWLSAWYGPPEKATLLTPRDMRAAMEKVSRIYGNHLGEGVFNRYQAEFQMRLLELSHQQVSAGRPAIGCTSGDSFACIFPNLDVAVCEMTRPIGNLAEFDYDLPRLLRQRFTPELRRLRDQCYCTNACNNSSSLKSRAGSAS